MNEVHIERMKRRTKVNERIRRRTRIVKQSKAISRSIIAKLEEDKNTGVLRNIIHELTFWGGFWGEWRPHHLIQKGEDWEESIKRFSTNINTQIMLATLVAKELLDHVTRDHMRFYLSDRAK